MTTAAIEDSIDLVAVHPDRTAQSTREMHFALTIEPCRKCGEFLSDHLQGIEFEVLYDPKGMRVWATCSTCGRLHSLQALAAARDWVRVQGDDVTSPGPSKLLQPHLLLQAFDRAFPQIWQDPTTLPLDERGAQNRLVSRARICTKELFKFLPEGASEIPESAIYEEGKEYYAQHRERFTRAYLQSLKDQMDAIDARYVADRPRYEAEYLAVHGPPKVPRGEVRRDERQAHIDWVKRGRTGDGQIDVFLKTLREYNLSGATIISGRFSEVTFERCSLLDATFDESVFQASTIARCNARGAEFRQSTLVDCAFRDTWLNLSEFEGATLINCTFDNVRLVLSSWTGARLTGCSFHGQQLPHSRWDDALVKHCDFSRTDLGDEPEFGHLPVTTRGARFEDCDFQRVFWNNRDLSGATFVRCKLADGSGAPSAYEGLVLEDCDLETEAFVQGLLTKQARLEAQEAKVAAVAATVVDLPPSISTDEQFLASLAEAVALVVSHEARGFDIPGYAEVDEARAHRFDLVYRALAAAAAAPSDGTRPPTLRWIFDPPNTTRAQTRNAPNAEALLAVLDQHAIEGKLPDAVRVEFVDFDLVPPRIGARMDALGITGVRSYLPGVTRGP
ncbi:MAG: pentapeptide repeat-containing protein [Kofleriaceae bacterium]